MAQKKVSNPFMEFDVEKLMKEMKFPNMPNMDVTGLMSSQRKNFEAITQANRVAMEGMQAVARRQAEIMREAMEEVSKASQSMTSTSDPQEMSTKQSEMARENMERSMERVRELAEMVAKSNSEAFEVLQRRMSEALEEFKEMMGRITQTK
jgi:phasin family protein